MSQPDLSIIVPVYNRAAMLSYSLESVQRARGSLRLEVIVVDDGSEPPLDPVLAALQQVGAQVIRQSNQGLLFARLRGAAAATGRYILFLDSDDLVSREKLTAQVTAMDRFGADVSYTDSAHCVLAGDFDSLSFEADAPARETTGIAEFFITVQPPPHSPVWRTEFLRRAIDGAFVGPSPLYNNVAEIWFYHNAAILPGCVLKVPGPHTIIGLHPGTRLTSHWEKLCIASLAMMEAFARNCPDTPAAARARRLVAEVAFRSWRRLPRGFSSECLARHLAVWRTLAPGSSPALGGPLFQRLSFLLGPERAGRLLRTATTGSYAACRTLQDDQVAELLRGLPSA